MTTRRQQLLGHHDHHRADQHHPNHGVRPERGHGVAVGADGRVVVLDAGNGEVDRVLLEGVRVDDPAKNSIARAPDRGEIFVTRPRPADTPTELVRVAADGSASESLGEGIAPSVSPDGSRLAYVRFIDRGARSPEPVLVIRELATGDERELARDDKSDFHFVPDTAWSADGDPGRLRGRRDPHRSLRGRRRRREPR